MSVKERFLKYVSFDTQSDPYSSSVPSTKKQLVLGQYLKDELNQMGISASLDEYGIVYGTIPANNDHQGHVIGLIAHMDTSSDASGHDIKPQLIQDYQGQKIVLNKNLDLVLDPQDFPDMMELIHHDLITTDGTTLLGADDKAGIAIIMETAQYLLDHPEIKHNDIKIAFTPDEEIGKGADHFNVETFRADYAYTLDGGNIAEFEYENFNAFSAHVSVHGKSIHPGMAKHTMINSIRVAYEFDQMLPIADRPELTEGYEGFNHLLHIEGSCGSTEMDYIIRNHDLTLAQKQCQDFRDIAEYLNKKYGYQVIDLEIKQSYLNMKEQILDHMYIINHVTKAMKQCGIEPRAIPIRGGTDGARLTYMGLPCPNLGTGGYNCHGPYEFVSVTMMEKQIDVVLQIIKNDTEQGV